MENEIKSKWNDIINYVKREFNVTDPAFRTWLEPLTVHSVNDHIATIIVNESKQGQTVNFISNRYKVPLCLAIEETTGHQYNIEFILSSEVKEENKKNVSDYTYLIGKYPFLNSGHSFDNFVVSSNNSMAHAAALAVSESPTAQVYNPLFIYGGSGLGKTHLMHSIARYIIEHNYNLKVMYVNSETFTNEVIEAIRSNKTKGDSTATSELKKKYRNVDILLIDDIQFIIGKESTQEEFFHTFNTLYESGKQIVLSSDKPPSDMNKLDARYTSRFAQGIVVDIQPPDYETSMAILLKLCEEKHAQIDDSILSYIASNIKSNIRDLEGAFKSIFLYSGLNKKPVDLELAKEILKNRISPNNKVNITIDYIMEIVADHFGIEKDAIASSRKTKDIALPRQVCMYLCKELTDHSFKEIGSTMGGRDHSTIIHGVKKIQTDIEVDESLKNTIEVIRKKINP